MKKKIFILGLVFCVLMVNISSVLAKEVSFADLKTRFIQLINDSNYTITDTDNKVTIALTNETHGPYSIEFNYAENVVSYVNNRDVSEATDQQKVYYAQVDYYFVLALIYTLLDVYDIRPDAEFSDDDYDEMGVTIETSDEISCRTENNLEVSTEPITSFSIDLTKFNNYTLNFQDAENSVDGEQLIAFLKSMMNPMNDNVFSSENLDDFSDLFDVDLDIEQETKDDIQVVNPEKKSVVKVPATKANSMYMLIGIPLVAVAVGVLVYFIILKR